MIKVQQTKLSSRKNETAVQLYNFQRRIELLNSISEQLQLYVMKTVAVVLLLLHGTSASPVPAAVQALTNAQTQTRRLYEKVSTAYDAFIQEEFNGDSVYCAEQIFILEELDNIRMTTAEWRQLGDEERLQRLRRNLQVFGLYLEEVRLDELDKDGHTDTAEAVGDAIDQLNGLMTSIAITNNVLGFRSPADVPEITTLRDPPSEYARSIRDCVVLRDFKTLVYRVHRDFTVLLSKYRR
ncbi:hypothetical protein Bbelb_319650 [Branchiostoma belcheri]|nr:hypothetical protein Bbelb_319650 [Branchiostoma belcheri]